jgi:hypothetical protein
MSTAVKRPGREADHSPTSAEVRKMWLYTTTPPYAFHGVVLNYLSTGTTLHLSLPYLTSIIKLCCLYLGLSSGCFFLRWYVRNRVPIYFSHACICVPTRMFLLMFTPECSCLCSHQNVPAYVPTRMFLLMFPPECSCLCSHQFAWPQGVQKYSCFSLCRVSVYGLFERMLEGYLSTVVGCL